MKEKLINFGKKFSNVSVKLLFILAGIILIFIFLFSLSFTGKFYNKLYNYTESMGIERDNILINGAFVVIAIFLIYFIYKKILSKINSKVLLAISIIIVGLVGLFWVNYLKVEPTADQKMVYEFSEKFLEKDYSILNKGQYLFLHPLQLGIIVLLCGVYKIFNISSPLVFQNLNIIFVILSNILLYKIANILYKNENTNKILLFLFMLFIILPMLSVLVYGNIIGLMFSLLSIYFVLKYFENRKIRYMFLSPITMMIAIAFKENCKIILIAICIILFLDFLNEHKKGAILGIVLMITLGEIIYPAIFFIFGKISKKEINKGVPMSLYIAMGMAERADRASGWYNIDFNVENMYIQSDYDEEKSNKIAKDKIKERLNFFVKNPKDFVLYYGEKVATTWLDPTYQTLWVSTAANDASRELRDYYSDKPLISNILDGQIRKVIVRYLDVLEVIIFLSSSIFVIWSIKTKNMNYKNVILILTFIGGFFFHIIWETKSLYALTYYYLLLPTAAGGLNLILDYISKKFKCKN